MRCWVDVAGLLPSRTVSRCRSVSPVGSLRLPGRAARRVSRACPGTRGFRGLVRHSPLRLVPLMVPQPLAAKTRGSKRSKYRDTRQPTVRRVPGSV